MVRKVPDSDDSRWGIVKDVASREKDSQKQPEHVYAELESKSKSKLRRDQLRRNMADPSYLNKMAAIDRQNSLVKRKVISKSREMDSMIDKRDPFQNQMSNKAAVGGEPGGKRIPGLLGGPGGGRRNSNPLNNDGSRALNSQKNRHQSADVEGSHLGAFDQEAYLSAQRMLEGDGDKMRRFQFNQVVSDATPPNRFLRDYRNPV